MKPLKCCVVIPCLNEAWAIGEVVAGARGYLPSVLVVDDGSTDSTAECAREAGSDVVRHARPQGKGRALRSGFSTALARGFEWALAMDGDGQHAAEDIPGFLAAGEGGARMVIGNRMGNLESMPGVRRIVNRWMSRTLAEFCGAEVPDSQCGFRLVHLQSWSSLQFTARHFEVESELVVRFAAAGYGLSSVPVRTRYRGERSKIHPVRDTVRWMRWWMSIRRELAGSASEWGSPVLSHDAV